MARTQLGIIIGPKGRGSNMAAIIAACSEGRLEADVRVVISPRDATPATEEAREWGVPVIVIPPSEEGYGVALMEALSSCSIICLAGFLRLLPTEVLIGFPGRILNIHPSLLPKFGGKGMYGIRVHEAVLAAGENESGCTVHLVSEHYDEGAILLQRRCAVLPDDTPETLAARVLKEEHIAYIQAIKDMIHAQRS